MKKHTHQRLSHQVRQVRRAITDQDLCFGKLLPQEQVQAALQKHHLRSRERLYTPVLTLWTFLYQVLSADQSCRAAVARLLALLGVGGDCSASAKTDPYCKARQRLPEKLLADLARHSGQELQHQVPSLKLLGGRPIKITAPPSACRIPRPIRKPIRSRRRRRREWASRSCVWWD